MEGQKEEKPERQNTKESVRKPFVFEAKERREKILDLIKKVGIWTLDVKLLANQFNVGERCIQKDIKWIKGHYRPEELRNIKIQLDIASKRAFNKALLALTEANGIPATAQAVDTMIKAIKNYREELEAWGIKDKAADRLDLTSGGKEIDETQIFIYLDKLRKEKSKKQ